jgi:hypothetical protein
LSLASVAQPLASAGCAPLPLIDTVGAAPTIGRLGLERDDARPARRRLPARPVAHQRERDSLRLLLEMALLPITRSSPIVTSRHSMPLPASTELSSQLAPAAPIVICTGAADNAAGGVGAAFH